MIRFGTPRSAGRLRLACFAAVALATVVASRPARGQASIEPVIDPSPMIAQGHLEGGINGDGSPRADGKTPLMLAAEAGDLKVIEYLLRHGADLDGKDAAGETALDLAQRRLVHEAAKILGDEAAAHPGASEYYANKTPVLAIVSARAQSGSPGCTAAHSLVVSVTDRVGNLLADAPVRFSVDGGGRNLLTQSSSPDSPSLLLRTDESGQCRVAVHLPKEPNARLQVTASAGVGEQVSKVKFTTVTNDGTGGDSPSCFAPTDVQGSLSPDGALDLSWRNRTDDETAIKIWVGSGQGLKPALTLPPHSTSAHIPAR